MLCCDGQLQGAACAVAAGSLAGRVAEDVCGFVRDMGLFFVVFLFFFVFFVCLSLAIFLMII